MSTSGSDALLHEVRLKGPWEYAVRTKATASEPPHFERVHLPSSRQLGLSSDALLVVRRRFHAPTGLEEMDRVVIRLPKLWAAGIRAELNGRGVEKWRGDAQLVDVTSELQPFNVLDVEIAVGAADPATEWFAEPAYVQIRRVSSGG